MSKLFLNQISHKHPVSSVSRKSWKKTQFESFFSIFHPRFWSFGGEILWTPSTHPKECVCKISGHLDFVWSSFNPFLSCFSLLKSAYAELPRKNAELLQNTKVGWIYLGRLLSVSLTCSCFCLIRLQHRCFLVHLSIYGFGYLILHFERCVGLYSEHRPSSCIKN
jgi:hypothetical protein